MKRTLFFYSTARVSKRPTDETAAQQSRAVLCRCPKKQRLLENLAPNL